MRITAVGRRKPTADRGPAKPSVFIGCSVEGLSFAKQLQLGLARVAKCRTWTQGVFGLGQGTLESLVEATRKSEFAILVLTPDNLATTRGRRRTIPRDNVVFELGLFMGAIGRERTFIVHSRDEPIELPTDLAGITTATFSAEDDDLQVALGEVCTQLEQAMTRIPRNIRELTGQWHSRYQRHDTPVGQWVTDMNRVNAKAPTHLIFKNYSDPVGTQYEAVGEFRGKEEIVGVWRETAPAATASGTFHLYVDPFGDMLYGVCTGPSRGSQKIYSGWILAREREKLDAAQLALNCAMLVARRRKSSVAAAKVRPGRGQAPPNKRMPPIRKKRHAPDA